MKKTILFLGALSLLMGKSMAQNQPLPDGKFEQWEQGKLYGDAGTYDDLANPFWKSLNILATLSPDMFTGPVTLFKDKGRSDAEGDFAPKMQSDYLKFGEDKEIFLPGVVGAMTVLIDDQTAVFGRPFKSRPTAIKGYMKYEPVNGDSASIFVEVYKYNEAVGRRQIIGRVEQIYKEKVEEWTVFELPLSYMSDIEPDSITVLFVSSAGYDFSDLFNCKGQIGSTLWVDDVEFVYSATPAETVQTPTFSVAAGEVEKGTKVAISCATQDAKIYYTTDGSTPSASSTEYTTEITIEETITLKAIAVKEGMANSSVAEATYTVKGETANENPVLASSNLYPNPSFNGLFNLNVKAACKMEVISISGQLVMRQNMATPGAYTVDLSRFAPGVYYIRLSNREGSATLKAVRR